MSTYAEMSKTPVGDAFDEFEEAFTAMPMEELVNLYDAMESGPKQLAAGHIIDTRNAAISAICALAQELDEAGWVCVPREATLLMCDNADAVHDFGEHPTETIAKVWAWMIKGASPLLESDWKYPVDPNLKATAIEASPPHTREA